MKPPSNARQISSKQSENLLRFVFIKDLTNSEYEKYQQLLKEQKMKKKPEQEDLISEISDNGTDHKYTNGKPAKKQEPVIPASEPTPQPDVPQNLSTEKPTLSKEQFIVSNTHDALCSGLAYYSGGTYNRNGTGVCKRFVAVKGFSSWAIYIGAPNDSISAIADWGDKVCLESHIKALINCDDVFDCYRF